MISSRSLYIFVTIVRDTIVKKIIVQIGDSLELSAPAGDFTLQGGTEPRVRSVFFAHFRLVGVELSLFQPSQVKGGSEPRVRSVLLVHFNLLSFQNLCPGVYRRRDRHHPAHVDAQGSRAKAIDAGDNHEASLFSSAVKAVLLFLFIPWHSFSFHTGIFLFTPVISLRRPSSSTVPPTPTSTLSKRNSASSSTQTNTSLAQVFVILTQTNKLHHYLGCFSELHPGRGTPASSYQRQVKRQLSMHSKHLKVWQDHLRVKLLPSSTPWTADAIGPLLPKGCQVTLVTFRCQNMCFCILWSVPSGLSVWTASVHGKHIGASKTGYFAHNAPFGHFLLTILRIFCQGGIGAEQHFLRVLWSSNLEREKLQKVTWEIQTLIDNKETHLLTLVDNCASFHWYSPFLCIDSQGGENYR